jgi:hypothetical protein
MEQSYACGVDMPFAAFWKELIQVYPNAKVQCHTISMTTFIGKGIISPQFQTPRSSVLVTTNIILCFLYNQ